MVLLVERDLAPSIRDVHRRRSRGARSSAQVHDVFLRTAPGEIIEPYIDCGARPAFVVADGSTYDEAINNARAAAQALSITTVDGDRD